MKLKILFYGAMILTFLAELAFKPALMPAAFWILLASTGCGFFLAAMIINVRWMRKYLKEIERLAVILTEEKNPDKYIAENEKRLEGKKSEPLRALLLCNIAAGYCEKREFGLAKDKLMQIRSERISGNCELMCFMYRAYVFFYLEDYRQALFIMENYRRRFNQLKVNERIEPFVAVLNIFEQIALRNYEKANELLFVAEERWGGGELEEDLIYIRKLLYKPSREF